MTEVLVSPYGGPPMHLDTDTGGGREKIRVLACSKSHLMRTALQNLLNSENDIMVVGAVTCEANSLHQSIRSQQPDILLFDVSINVEPVEVVKDSLASNEGGLRIVLLGTYDTEDMMIKSLLKGARGALRHDDEYFSIADAIRIVARGDAVLAPSLSRRLLEILLDPWPQPAMLPRTAAPLSSRELEVLLLMAHGLSNAVIAEELVISEATVRSHVHHLMSKLGLKDRVQAVVFAYRNGLIHPLR